MKTKTCTAHCRACGRHFSSNAAFEKHRRESACVDPVEITAKDGSAWFTTVKGDCRVAGYLTLVGVDIHQEAAAADRGASLRSAA